MSSKTYPFKSGVEIKSALKSTASGYTLSSISSESITVEMKDANGNVISFTMKRADAKTFAENLHFASSGQ